MDNKEGKTFAELFSSSLEEPKAKEQTFSNLLKENSNEEKKEDHSPVTFDSLFDKTPETEINKAIVEPNSQELQVLENEESVQEQPELLNFNSIFCEEKEQIINNVTSPLDSNYNDTSEAVNKTEKSEQESILFNPFFENEEDGENGIPYQLSPSKVEDDNNNLEITKNELFSEKNLFFAIDTNTEDDTTQANKELIEPQFRNNPFININNDEQTINEEVPGNDNPTTNPFFPAESSEMETSKVDANPFFQDASLNDTVNNEFENKTITSDFSAISIEKTNKEESESKTISPFFAVEDIREENPFFQNQLNLIENQVTTSSINHSIDTTKSKHYNVKIVKKKEPLIKVILGVLSYALFIWLLLIGAALLFYVLDIKIRAAKGDYSSPTFNAYVVLTGSMLPEIQVNDVVVTKKVDAAELQEGDVITFASADQRFLGTIITHRIIKKNPPSGTEGYTFQTQGDNNNVADSALVPEDYIYGKVILKIPKLGYLQEFLTSKGGWIVVILIPCLAVISYDIVKLIKGLKRKNYKNIKVQK